MKRLFSMIAAPIMALFAGANGATAADSVVTAEPAAAVQEATAEQAPKEITPDGVDPQDGGLSGKVTAIDGSTVTVALAEKPELPADGQQPADGEAPAKPDGDAQPADGQQPPEKPADDTAPEAPADGAKPDAAPEKPEGDAQPADNQQPPEKPADDAASEAPVAGEKPDNAPAKPEGDAPELTFSDETTTYDLSNAVITVEDNGTVSTGSLSDITVDSLLLLKCDEDGNVTAVTVLLNG